MRTAGTRWRIISEKNDEALERVRRLEKDVLWRYRWPRRVMTAVYVFLFAATAAVIVFTAGFATGYKVGGENAAAVADMGVGPSSMSLEDGLGGGSRRVTGTGRFVVDGFTIELVRGNDSMLGTGTTGRANFRRTMWIQSGRSVEDVYTTCVHEYGHLVLPAASHVLVNELDDRAVVPVCLRFLAQAADTDVVHVSTVS